LGCCLPPVAVKQKSKKKKSHFIIHANLNKIAHEGLCAWADGSGCETLFPNNNYMCYVEKDW